MAIIDQKGSKYSHPEVERKFLVANMPPNAHFRANILDHYIPNTTFRLRKMQTTTEIIFKLGQKVRPNPHDTRVILHTNFYISETEYTLLLSTLPSHQLEKKRFTFHGTSIPMAIDVFQGELDGLIMAEIDFGANGDSSALDIPPFAVAEVTDDEHFTGGRLALTTQAQLKMLLKKFQL